MQVCVFATCVTNGTNDWFVLTRQRHRMGDPVSSQTSCQHVDFDFICLATSKCASDCHPELLIVSSIASDKSIVNTPCALPRLLPDWLLLVTGSYLRKELFSCAEHTNLVHVLLRPPHKSTIYTHIYK